MRDKKIYKLLLTIICLLVISFISEGAQTVEAASRNGWNKSKTTYYVNGKKATGIYQIGTRWYSFDSKGKLITGKKGWVYLEKKAYYYRNSNGTFKTGWQKVNGSKKWYYFNSGGSMRTGWLTKNGKTYYLRKNGQMVTGKQSIRGQRYAFNSDGSMVTGWVKNSKNKQWYFYRIEKNGNYRKGSMIQGTWLKNYNKHSYYFNADGTMVQGWKKIGSYYYYFKKAQTSKFPEGAMTTGWMKKNGKKYYFSSKGVRKSGFVTISKKNYHFSSKGVMSVGWFTSNNKKYYAYTDGELASGLTNLSGKKYYFKSFIMMTGWHTISGKKYYFNSNGVMLTNRWIDNKYYVGSDGAWVKGYQESADWRWPLSSKWNTITSYFGSRSSPGGIGSTNHKGIDISESNIYGAKIYAVADGTVVWKASPGGSGGFGNVIWINHGQGMISEYAHMSKFASNISVGTKVKRGQVIGYVGSTGNSTGPHLHFGVRLNNVYKDPLNYVKQP